MGLFKNKVGRPSNEDIKKRRIFYACIMVFTVLLIGLGFFLTNKYINKTVGAVSQNKCVMPYTRKNCYGKKNETIKKVQRMLKDLKYYTRSVNGNFNIATYKAIKKFQQKKGIRQDGKIGPETLSKMASDAGVKYFVINFDKNGGKGDLNSSYDNKLVVINGISTKIPSVELIKSGSTHFGYFATAKNKKGESFRFGGFSPENGGKASKAYSYSKIGNKKFYDYLYKIGSSVTETGWESVQEITFKAVYCDSGEYYDTNKSACVKKTPESSYKYGLTSEQKLVLMASVCQENGGSYASAKAVMDTMMNRTDNKICFANTLWGVLTEQNQFQAYHADHYERRISNGSLISSCNWAKKAVNNALKNPSKRSHKYLCFSFQKPNGSYKKIDGIYYSNACASTLCVN